MNNGKFEIYTDEATPPQTRFRLKAGGNHEKIGRSQGYKSKQSAEKGIASVKENSQDRDNFKIEPTEDSKHFWNLYAENSRVILSASETYESKQGAEVGINSVMKNASKAEIIDLT